MRIILSPEDVNLYLSEMLNQAGMTIDGTIEWTWDEDVGPSAVVTLGAPKPVPAAVPQPFVEPPKPRVDKVTVKLPSRPVEELEELEELTRANIGDLPEGNTEMPKTKKKTRGPGKKTLTKPSSQLNVTPRVRAYQEEVAKNAKLLIHPLTGDVVNGSAASSTEYPAKE
jgi:hypothetical protein